FPVVPVPGPRFRKYELAFLLPLPGPAIQSVPHTRAPFLLGAHDPDPGHRPHEGDRPLRARLVPRTGRLPRADARATRGAGGRDGRARAEADGRAARRAGTRSRILPRFALHAADGGVPAAPRARLLRPPLRAEQRAPPRP